MKTDYTHIFILLDRSGSMESIKNDIIGGFNNFVAEQAKLPGKLTITLAQFDEQYDVLYDFADIRHLSPLTAESFMPRGSTALYDFTARIVIEGGEALSKMKEDQRPSKILVTIITDGYENASRKYTSDIVLKIIKHQEQVYNWEFIYIGANQDAYKVAESIGMKGANYPANEAGTKVMMEAYSSSTTHLRSAKKNKFNLTDEDISKLLDKA